MSKTIQDKLQEMATAFPATVIVHKAEDGGYWVESPQFGGCFASADTITEALNDFKQCLFDYFDIPVKSQKMDSLKYVSSDFPEPKNQRNPTSMGLIQSPELLAV